MTSKILTYTMAEIFGCRADNMVLPKELEQYCQDKYKRNQSQYEQQLINAMVDIAKSLNTGVNPNDMAIMNIIRGTLNKLTQNNYPEILAQLKLVKYNSQQHFLMLANELIVKAMNDIIAIKGLETNKNQMTPSEIYVNILLEFSNYFIEGEKDTKNEKKEIHKFKNIVAILCQKYFKDFTDSKLKMDQNNQHRVNNYKGYMNLLGLLFAKKCFKQEIIFKCLTKVCSIIVDGGLVSEECDNYFTGFERLSSQVLGKFEKMIDRPIDEADIKEFTKLHELLYDCNTRISGAVNQGDPTKGGIRKFSTMIHNQNVIKLDILKKKIMQLE